MPNYYAVKHIFFLFYILGIAIISASCNRFSYRTANGAIWRTSYHITYYSDRDLTDSILLTLQDLDNSLNYFNDSSLLSRLNQSASIQADRSLTDVYQCSRKINQISDGEFDPTLSPLIDAWGFGKGHQCTADTARVDSLLQCVGLEKTYMQRDSIIKTVPEIKFNFSAIAKGYACDRVAEMLEHNGVKDYIVEIGGEIRAGEKSESGEGWRISIDRPVMQTDTVVHDSELIISLTDCGMATSGNYRNFHLRPDGTPYAHTISAKTGRPALTDLISVTTICPTSMEADALATTFMAIGYQRARALADSLQIPAFFILTNGQTIANPQFEKFIASEAWEPERANR